MLHAEQRLHCLPVVFLGPVGLCQWQRLTMESIAGRGIPNDTRSPAMAAGSATHGSCGRYMCATGSLR